MKNNNPKKGFTLIELLVVIAIISVLSGVVMQSLSSTRAKSRDAVRLQNIESIAKGFQVATTGANGGQFPSSSGYKCLGVTVSTCWAVGYGFDPTVNSVLSSGLSGAIPRDPLFTVAQDGGAYVYNSNDSGGAYLFWRMESTSCGRGIGTLGVPTGSTCKLYLGPPTTP